MARYVFASISGRQIGYTLHTDSLALWDGAYRTAQALGARYGCFTTYGDGLTQHETERPVTLRDAADYFASLGAFMATRLDQPFEEGEARNLFWCWPTSTKRDRIEFALSVVYKAGGPTRYFTMYGGDFKVSGRSSLQHDKRWHPVKEPHDGTVSGALSVLHTGEDPHETHFLLERWVERDSVRDIVIERNGWARETASEFMGKESSDSDMRAMAVAYELAKAAFATLGARLALDSKLANYRRSLPKPEADSASKETS